jgi:hypothetical protein
MAPTFKLVAMIVSPVGELVADSVTIPVQSFNRYKVTKFFKCYFIAAVQL